MTNEENPLSDLSIDELIPILDSISDAIFIDDAQGFTIWINKASEELYKIKRKDVIGKHVSFLEREGIFTPSVARIVMEQKKEVSIIHQNKDGKRLLTTGIPIMDADNNITKIITTTHDTTELVNLQNELESVQNALSGLNTQEGFSGIVANSPSMYNVIQLTRRLSDVDSTVLITGESGVGKSETALELVKRGHRLVADDVVEIKKLSDNELVGKSPDIVRHMMEIRGMGIIDVSKLYGLGAVMLEKSIDVCAHFEIGDVSGIDRLGITQEYITILGVQVPKITIPVRPGRNLAIILEVAAMNFRLRSMGHITANELDEKMLAILQP